MGFLDSIFGGGSSGGNKNASMGSMAGLALALGLAPFTGGASLSFIGPAMAAGGGIGGMFDQANAQGNMDAAMKNPYMKFGYPRDMQIARNPALDGPRPDYMQPLGMLGSAAQQGISAWQGLGGGGGQTTGELFSRTGGTFVPMSNAGYAAGLPAYQAAGPQYLLPYNPPPVPPIF